MTSKVFDLPVTMTLHRDRAAGGHRVPYFLFNGEIILTPKGKGYEVQIEGKASLPSGESTLLEMVGPLTSKGTWVTTHPWGWLGFQPINLHSCPYPPIWGWHECPSKGGAPRYLLEEPSIWQLPTSQRLNRCEISGRVR